jgi:hypothetical protein
VKYKILSPVHAARYADLLQALEHTFVERFGISGRKGSFVSRTVKGRSYWYFQHMVSNRQEHIFLGPDSPELQAAIRETKETRETIKHLCAALTHADGFVFRGEASRALESMSDSGLFLAGSTLIGTNAFMAFQNALGVHWQTSIETTQTTDIDFAQFSRFKLGVPLDVANAVQQSLRDLEANPVWKSLDRKAAPWTYFMKGGSGFSIEFLTPHIGSEENGTQPVPLPWAGISAQPIRYMDYLIEISFHAAALVKNSAVLINLPDPGRFALHKLIVHERRPLTNAVKKKKDLAQAETLISFLSEKHPDVLKAAWQDLLNAHRTWGKLVQQGAQKLSDNVKDIPIVSTILKTDFNRAGKRNLEIS